MVKSAPLLAKFAKVNPKSIHLLDVNLRYCYTTGYTFQKFAHQLLCMPNIVTLETKSLVLILTTFEASNILAVTGSLAKLDSSPKQINTVPG